MRFIRDKIAAWCRRADVSIFHQFYRPPYGGGNQFLLALRGEFERRGLRVEANVISPITRACLFNSFNFDFSRLRRMRQPSCRMVHRVDGPIGLYRGVHDGTDDRIFEINQEIADATVFQSRYSLNAHLALGFQFKAPVVIMNTVDPKIFYPNRSRGNLMGEKVRLISISWSTNPNKGAATYGWLEENLDWTRFDYTFVGRSPIKFRRIRMIPAVGSLAVACLLRQHDIYITASSQDPCSNSLLEALASGLPAICAMSGGHPEIVGEAGFGFSSQEEIPELLDRLVGEYEARQARISIPRLTEVANQYLSVLGILSEECSSS